MSFYCPQCQEEHEVNERCHAPPRQSELAPAIDIAAFGVQVEQLLNAAAIVISGPDASAIALLKMEMEDTIKMLKEKAEPAPVRPLILTVEEIKDLAEFAGVMRHGIPLPLGDPDERETEIVIGDCPKHGVDNDGTIEHFRHMAWYYECPEDGVMPLGSKLLPNTKAEP